MWTMELYWCWVMICSLFVSTELTSCNVLYNKMDVEATKMLVDAVKEKDVSLCGIAPDQTSADYNGFEKVKLQQPDAILLASDLSKPGVTSSLTSLK